MPGTKSRPCPTPGCKYLFKPRRTGPKAALCILCRRQSRHGREREAARVRRAEKRAKLKGAPTEGPELQDAPVPSDGPIE